jgi:hypothetical protein
MAMTATSKTESTQDLVRHAYSSGYLLALEHVEQLMRHVDAQRAIGEARKNAARALANAALKKAGGKT